MPYPRTDFPEIKKFCLEEDVVSAYHLIEVKSIWKYSLYMVNNILCSVYVTVLKVKWDLYLFQFLNQRIQNKLLSFYWFNYFNDPQ